MPMEGVRYAAVRLERPGKRRTDEEPMVEAKRREHLEL